MIAPAETVSPPNTFTPSRFEVESRPLREEPPPFLCAMTGRGYQLLRRGCSIRVLVGLLLRRGAPSQLHLGHLEHREELPVTGLAGVPRLRPVFEDLDLVALLIASRLGHDDGLRPL